MKCFYCERDNSTSKQVYHIVPHAAGNQSRYLGVLGELTLPLGLRCDPCNRYFSREMDRVIANHPYVQQYRALYGVNSRKGSAVFEQGSTRIEATRSGVIGVSGVEVDKQGNFTVSRPSLRDVNHWLVSRMVHKIALETELLEMAANPSLSGAHDAARQEPLASIVRYVRKPHVSDYRPYGLEGRGASRVMRPTPFRFFRYGRNGEVLENGPHITGYIVGVPNARFTCTLAEEPGLLRDMLKAIDNYGFTTYFGTSEVFSKPGGGLLSDPEGDQLAR